MRSSPGRGLLVFAGVLMLLLGLVRGLGGALLLVRGPGLDPAILASAPVARLLGALLLGVGLALVAGGIGLFRGRPRAVRFGVVATLVFVLDGLLNGLILYGRPTAGGTFINLGVATTILALLLLGTAAGPKQR